MISFGNSLYRGEIPARLQKGEDVTDPVESLKKVAEILKLPISGGNTAKPAGKPDTFIIEGTTGAQKAPVAGLTYVQTPDGKLELAWRVETDIGSQWLITYMDAEKNERIVDMADYNKAASYEVL